MVFDLRVQEYAFHMAQRNQDDFLRDRCNVVQLPVRLIHLCKVLDILLAKIQSDTHADSDPFVDFDKKIEFTPTTSGNAG